MKIGVTQIILGNMSIDDTIDLCRAAGYQAVELTFRDGKDIHVDLDDDHIRAVAKKFYEADIPRIVKALERIADALEKLDNNTGPDRRYPGI